MKAFLCDIENNRANLNRLCHLMIHLIGLGGAGKTTAGKLLSIKMNIPCIDLDECFIENAGDIAEYIDSYGYAAYAKRNIELYLHLKQGMDENTQTIVVCSSGFMTYPENIISTYLQLKQDIEVNPFTFLLVPSLNLDECIEIIVERQLARPYLNSDAEKEELKIRKRFEIYHKLNCYQVLTNQPLDTVVGQIAQQLGCTLKMLLYE